MSRYDSRKSIKTMWWIADINVRVSRLKREAIRKKCPSAKQGRLYVRVYAAATIVWFSFKYIPSVNAFPLVLLQTLNHSRPFKVSWKRNNFLKEANFRSYIFHPLIQSRRVFELFARIEDWKLTLNVCFYHHYGLIFTSFSSWGTYT